MNAPKHDYNYRPPPRFRPKADAQPQAEIRPAAPPPPRAKRVQDAIDTVFAVIGVLVLMAFNLYMWVGSYGDMFDIFIAWLTTGLVGTIIVELPVLALYGVVSWIAGRIVAC